MALYDPNEFKALGASSVDDQALVSDQANLRCPDPSGFDPSRGLDFTPAEILAWARTKPADEWYDYGDIQGCAVYQFVKERGLPIDCAGGFGHWFDTEGEMHGGGIPAGVLCNSPNTFGALADRLKQALAQ